jgi:hypothetical protein
MNGMNKNSIGSISASLLLVFSVFTLLSISEVNAEDTFVNANGYENTIIVEFENDSGENIKTIRMWPGGEVTFQSFKSEPGWGGGKYSDGKLVIFTATNSLDPGESVKFGLVTSEKIDGINWKVLDLNDKEIDAGKTVIQTISETESSFIEDESKEVEQAKETGDDLYGTKKFIPEKIRVGSDLRLVGNGFSSEQNLKLYLDNTILKSVNTDKQGNFLTTISIPDDYNVGTSEFVIKDESGNVQSSNISIDEPKNRFLKTTKFDVTNIPAEIRYEETLTISGNAYPQSAIILSFENMDRILEKARVVTANSNGEWIFEETIDRTETTGEKYVIIQNNNNKTTKNLNVKSDYLVQISTSAPRYNEGDAIIVTGNGEPMADTVIWIKDEGGNIVHYDTFPGDSDGTLYREIVIDEQFATGTYVVILKQAGGSDASFFGIGKYPSSSVIVLLDKTNFSLNSQVVLSVVGPPSNNMSVKILDSNDNVKQTGSFITTSIGKNKYTVDLEDLSSGIYRAVISTSNIQDSAKFSVGLEPGSGEISLISIKETYSPGESVLVLGYTGHDARITVTLYEPDGNISTVTETFSDSSGNFNTNQIGIPLDGELGNWKITANSRLDTKSVTIKVSLPTEKGLTLEIDDTEFDTSDIVLIKGIAQTDSSRLSITITDQNGGNFASLETPVTGDGTFSTPWTIPTGTETGTYTITVSDSINSTSMEIFIR